MLIGLGRHQFIPSAVRFRQAGQVFCITLHTCPTARGQPIVGVYDRTVLCIDPVKPAAVESPVFDNIKITAVIRVNHQACLPQACTADLCRGYPSRGITIEPDVVGRHQSRVVGAGNRNHVAGRRAQHRELTPEHLGVTDQLLIAVRDESARFEVARTCQANIRRHFVTLGRGPL